MRMTKRMLYLYLSPQGHLPNRMKKKQVVQSKRNGAKTAPALGIAVMQDFLDASTGMADVKEAAPSKPFPIVGVGASAGGLEALKELLGAMPLNTGMAFVLIQHMDPTHESVLSKLLGAERACPLRRCRMAWRSSRIAST